MAIRLHIQENKVRLKVRQSGAVHLSASEGVPVYPENYTGDYEVTPTELEQSLEAHGLMMTEDVSVHAIPSDYVGSAVDRRSSTDITASGATVTVPNGFYEENASKSVQSGSAATPTGGITANPTISVDTNGLITASVNKSESITPIISEGYVTEGTAGTITFSGSNTSQLSTQGATTITPSTSEQTAVSAGKYTTGEVKVSAMPTGAKNAQVNTWGWTSTTKKLTITFPNATSGYYTGAQAGAVTPVEMTRQTATVTPSETSQEVTPTNSTYYIEKVTVDAIPSDYVGSGVTQRTSSDLTASGATVTAPSGYYAENATKIIASGTEGTPTATKGTVSNHAISVTPSVTNAAGYISGGTKNGTAVSVSASELVSGTKSISANGTGIDVTNYASVDVAVPSQEPNLQAKTNIAPSTSSQTITADTGYDGLSSVQINAMPSGTEGTPTATKGTVSNHSVSVTPSVTNTAGYISGGTKTGTAVSVSASELVSGTVNITSSGNTDVTNYATASVASGSATASATKGAVSNHSVTVTPSVTRTAGYITAGTASGTAVTVSASELVSGSQTITDNGTVDVTNLAEVVVSVEGGGGGGVQIGKTTKTLSSAASSIQFTGLSGSPTSFVVTSAEDIATNTSGVTAVVFDGTSLHGQTMTTQVTADTGFTKSYSNGTLTITATTASFQAVEYKLVYTYGGSASDIETADVQVGSGATSITFPVTGRPAYWSCIFKSDFSTSSGYQRVIEVVNDGSSTYGLAMDSSAHAASSWTASYSGSNLTISSQSTNVGGYFHQPGYYQLTYYVDESAPQYQSKTVTPTTSQQTVTPDTGYDALSQVTVNAIPSEYIIPTGNLAITQNGNNINVAQYATVSVNVSGGGGTSKNTQVVQGTTRTTSSTMTAIGAEMTVSKTGTYDIYWSAFRSTTSGSYTYATQLYIDGVAYGSENATWSNHCQNNHLANVSLTVNQKIRVRGRNSRGSSYYIYAPMLVIVEK